MPAETSRKRREALAHAAEQALAVYTGLQGTLPDRDCRLRTGCCRFRATGLVPQLTLGEAAAAALALRAAGRTSLVPSSTGDCPLLDDQGMCRIYEARPLGCRTYFCAAAGGPIQRVHVREAVRALESIDDAAEGCGPRALPVAVAAVLSELGR